MSHQSTNSQRGVIQFLFENSIFLIVGAVAALAWANMDRDSHDHFFNTELTKVVDSNGHETDHSEDHSKDHDSHGKKKEGDDHKDDDHKDDNHKDGAAHADNGHAHAHDEGGHGGGHHGLSLHFIINDILMAFFFAIAGKEVWEALLPGGALSNPKKAATPLLATLGGIVGPAGVYILGAYLSGMPELSRGWAIPCATDIAFSYLVARIIFGNGHPAIAFLLLLAIADDAAGLMILAVFYPTGELNLWWLLLTVAAIVTGFVFQKVFRLHSFWWYLLIPGVMSWFSFHLAGIHAALGLVPIIPTLPHASTDLGIFAREELQRHDTLNEFEHWWKNPVEIFLGLFGLCNAGVAFSSVGTGTWLVLAGLLVGKPLGITFFTYVAEKWLKMEMPQGMGYRHVFSLGLIAGIGFTVALFVSTAAFDKTSPYLDSVKMGALASFGAAFVAYIAARAIGVRPDGAAAVKGDS